MVTMSTTTPTHARIDIFGARRGHNPLSWASMGTSITPLTGMPMRGTVTHMGS
jgi:hypothetical protein